MARLLSRAWVVVGLLWVVALLNYLDRIMITTMRLSLKDAISMTDAQFGLLTSVFLWVYGFLSPCAGFLSDRFSRSWVIVGSLAVWSLATLLTAYTHSFEMLMVSRVVMGISEACYVPAALALIADYHRGPTRSFATGVHMTGLWLGGALGGLGGWIAERAGWHAPFLVFGWVGVGYCVVLALTLRDAPREAEEMNSGSNKSGVMEAMGSLLPDWRFWVLAIYWGLLGMAGWTLFGWVPTYLNEHFHLGQGAAGLSATGYLTLAGFVGVLVGGAWADRWSRRTQRARLLVPVIGLCIAAPAVLLTGRTEMLALALLGLVGYGFGRAFSDANMMPILCVLADPRYRATGYGVLNMFACVSGGVMIYVGGWLKDHQVGLSAMLHAVAVCLVLCVVALVAVMPRDENKEPAMAGDLNERSNG